MGALSAWAKVTLITENHSGSPDMQDICSQPFGLGRLQFRIALRIMSEAVMISVEISEPFRPDKEQRHSRQPDNPVLSHFDLNAVAWLALMHGAEQKAHCRPLPDHRGKADPSFSQTIDHRKQQDKAEMQAEADQPATIDQLP